MARVLLTKNEQKLLQLQKSVRVVEVFSSNSETDSDYKLVSWFVDKENLEGPLFLLADRQKTQNLAAGVYTKAFR